MSIVAKVRATVSKITRVASDVCKVDFEVARKYTRFKAGQFLHLALDDFDPAEAYWPESRVFSICSTPRSNELSIIYSVKGSYTTRMREELTIGDEYWLKLPYGDFIIEQLVPPNATAVLVAGGTGISPYVSYLEEGIDKGFNRPVYLAYAVRSPDRLAFEDLLNRAQAVNGVDIRIWSEGTNDESDLITDTGRLDIDAVVKDVNEMLTPHFLLSGPPAMLESFSRRLQAEHGVESSRIHIDEWE